MKTTLAIFALIFPLCVLPLSVSAAEKSRDETPVEERLARVDLSIVVRQYKKVKLMLAEAEIQRELAGGVSEMSDRERAALAGRIEVLNSLADKLAAAAVEADKRIQAIRHGKAHGEGE